MTLDQFIMLAFGVAAVAYVVESIFYRSRQKK